jgi:hypothetical protein
MAEKQCCIIPESLRSCSLDAAQRNPGHTNYNEDKGYKNNNI